MTHDLATAILASAYNCCGPMAGEFARPETVLSMVDASTIQGYAAEYSRLGDALYSSDEVAAAVAAVLS